MERRDNPLITGLTTATVAGLSAAVLLAIIGGVVLLCVLLTAACILVAGMLRRPWAFHLGWAIQIASLALGFVVSTMFLLGAIFLALWAGAFFIGAKIDRERVEREALERQWAAEHGDAG